MIRILAAIGLVLLGGCATPLAPSAAPVEVKIIAFNDFHGHLEPPKQAIDVAGVKVPAGGAAYFASAVAKLRAATPHSITVSAGDLISASPLVSALFLDEPTIHAMNLIGLDLNAVGNHEFDRGRAELLRIQNGGCEKHGAREPCAVEPYPGAKTRFLSANTVTETGATLFPSYAIRRFGRGRRAAKIAFIGMTLEGTPQVVTPAGVAGLDFRDEAETANALVPKLRAEGADAIVVLIHQGAASKGPVDPNTCAGLEGELMPILAALDPAIDLVVSGHTHRAYVCELPRPAARPLLVTSAGQYGTQLTDIVLTIDPRDSVVTAARAANIVVQSEAFTGSAGAVTLTDSATRFLPDPGVAAVVARYAAASEPLAARVVGRLAAPATQDQTVAGEQVMGDLIADAQLAATMAPDKGRAQVAFMNPGGVRAPLVPVAGEVTYGQLFAVQPFGNNLIVKSFTGRQIKALLEQQFTPAQPRILLPSRGFAYAYDRTRPVGQRIIAPTLDGRPLEDAIVYRVTMNSFLASGGDGFSVFNEGTDPLGGAQDIDALEAYIFAADVLTPPVPDRIRVITPK